MGTQSKRTGNMWWSSQVQGRAEQCSCLGGAELWWQPGSLHGYLATSSTRAVLQYHHSKCIRYKKNNNNLKKKKKSKDLLWFLSAIVTWRIRPAPPGSIPQQGAGQGEARGEQPASHPSTIQGTRVILSQHKVKVQTSKGTQFCFKFNLSTNVLFDFSSLSFSMVRSTVSTEDMIKKLRCKFHIMSH